MQLKITREEIDFLSFLIVERRNQIKALNPLWDRHHRQDAKRILDGFPYEKGELIPYLKRSNGNDLLLWEASTHSDLVADLRDHLTELQKPESESLHNVVIVHGLLKKIEAMTEDARVEMKNNE